MGITYAHLGQYDKLVSTEEEAIRVKPDDAAAWYVLGMMPPPSALRAV